jgi:hypothetical protein
VPVKWQISDGSGGFIRDLSAVAALMYAETACDAVTYATAIDAAPAGGSGLHYDLEADQYVFNWKTDPALSDRCVLFILRLADGTEHLARFRFK